MALDARFVVSATTGVFLVSSILKRILVNLNQFSSIDKFSKEL